MQNRIKGLTILVVVMSMAAAACTHRPYHPNKTDREWVVDHEACEVWVREDIRDEPDTYDEFDEMRLIRQCMKDKGWEWQRTGLFNFKQVDDE
jgi:hypothetical protein